MKTFKKADLKVKTKEVTFEPFRKSCTNRPSLSLKKEISRNIVEVTEVVPVLIVKLITLSFRDRGGYKAFRLQLRSEKLR